MRKESREMPAEWALEVLDKAPYITVSMADDEGMPYGLPLSLVRTDDNTFYFHCALEGKKLDILSKNPRVCLSAVTKCKPTVGPKDGSFTLEFKSAIAFGTAEIVEDDTEKIAALRAICERFLPKHMDAFDASIARSLERTAVVRITLTEPPVGKRKQYDEHGEELAFMASRDLKGVPKGCEAQMKAAIKWEQSGACYNYAEHEQARPKVKAAIKWEQSGAYSDYAEHERFCRRAKCSRPKVKYWRKE